MSQVGVFLATLINPWLGVVVGINEVYKTSLYPAGIEEPINEKTQSNFWGPGPGGYTRVAMLDHGEDEELPTIPKPKLAKQAVKRKLTV